MKKIFSLALVLTVLLSCMTITGYAEGFTDMPDDWSTAALTAAVENGLLNGSGGKILPKDNLTRAQMATIIVRALNGQSTTALTDFSDVPADAWYHEYMQKAVYMEVFKGDGTGLLKPDDNITREQVFAVIARAFKLEGADASVLDTFDDKADNSEWAIPTTAAMVENGYIKGSGGALNPKAYITRAEFAQIMHNIVKTYIDEPQILKGKYEGNVIIRCSGVTLASDVEITGSLVVCEGSNNITIIPGAKAEGLIDNRTQTEKSTGSGTIESSATSTTTPEVSGDNFWQVGPITPSSPAPEQPGEEPDEPEYDSDEGWSDIYRP